MGLKKTASGRFFYAKLAIPQRRPVFFCYFNCSIQDTM